MNSVGVLRQLCGVIGCLLVLSNGPVQYLACDCPHAHDLTFSQRLLGDCCAVGHQHGPAGNDHHHTADDPAMGSAEHACRHFQLTNPVPCVSGYIATCAGPSLAILPKATFQQPRTANHDDLCFPVNAPVKPPNLHIRTIVLRI